MQQSLADANTVYTNFVDSIHGRRTGPTIEEPRFTSRRDHRQAVRFTRNARFVAAAGGRPSLPKIGDVQVRWSCRLPPEPSSVTIVQDSAGRCFASFVVRATDEPLPEIDAEVGSGVVRGALRRHHHRQPAILPPRRTQAPHGGRHR